ncbi:pilus assembly protein TadG-related protein [Beijerinckia sp. L45]|uniref:pilus assembly protein TadG-related protein n=1 Tax=Beijerinckia sp. L45 TaxID=1641855 RepID=UPI00131B3C19|nr:pilus assembly protein TadG-related protein [Beijerinckia sp. L45]
MRFRFLRAFWRRDQGSVTVIAAIGLPVLVGFAALAVEFGHGLLSKAEYQRVADLSAYAGALAYGSSGSATTMTAAAQAVAVLNGLSASNVTVNLIPSPRNAANQAVSVSIAKANVLLLAPVLGYGSTLPVRSSSYAEMGAAPAPCILALNAGGTGVTLSGSAAVTAPLCAVASNASLTVPCLTTIKAKAVTYNTTVPSQACSGITSPTGGSASISKVKTSDPLASNAGVIAALAHVSTVQTFAPYTFTPLSISAGIPLNFNFSILGLGALLSALPGGCLAVGILGNYTVTCAGYPSYKFGTITVDSGVTVAFNVLGASSTTYNISGSIVNAGTITFGPGTYNFTGSIANTGTLTFAAGTYNVAQGISNSATLSFKAGTFNVGGGMSCNGSTYSICNTGTATFAGPSTFALSSGIFNGGNATLALGGGTSNSFQVGAAGNGDALDTGNNSKTTFADATGASNLFQLNGNINAIGATSCLTLSAAAQHDVDGFFASAGGVTLGAGVYTFDGYIAFGPSGGVDVSCNGVTVGVAGTGVTLVTSGASTATGSSCSGTSFCLASGYSNVTFAAPTSGTMANLVVIGPAAKTSNATFTSNASTTILSGVFYYPDGPITLGGSASIGSVSGQCLQIVGSQVSISGGATAASTCIGSGSGTQTVRLVQ